MKKIILFVFALSIGFLPVKVSAFSGPGTGVSGDPYMISNCFQLQEMSNSLAAYYKLSTDIDCSDTTNWNGNEGFAPVGTSGTPFTGSLDGNNYTITDIFINRASGNQGLFGSTSGATIMNVKITGSITGKFYTGGLVGEARDGTAIKKSGSSVVVSAGAFQYAGGLAGYLGGSTIENSYNLGSVSGDTQVGGLVGDVDNSTITNSYSTGAVSGSNSVGGLIGSDSGSNTFNNLYWDITTSGTSTGCNQNGLNTCVSGFTGKTTTQMKNQDTFDPETSNTYGFPLSDYANYRYVKLEISRVRDGSNTNCYTGDVCTQASEFELLVDGFPVSLSGVSISNPDGVSPGGQGVDKLIDGNVNTKFLDAAFGYSNSDTGSTIAILDAGSGHVLTFNGYNLATGDDQDERDPVSWTISGSNDGSSYTPINTQTLFSTTTSRKTYLGTHNGYWNFYDIWGIKSNINSGYPFIQYEADTYTYRPPTVVSVSPVDGAIGRAIDVPIVITFSEPMEIDSSPIINTAPCGGSCATYTEAWSNNNRTLTLTKSNGLFDANTEYTIGIYSIRDSALNQMSDHYVWSFTTYIPMTMTEERQVPQYVTEEDAIYYFSTNEGVADYGDKDYLAEECYVGGDNDHAETVIDPVNHTFYLRNTTVGHTYSCRFELLTTLRGTSNFLQVGPFTVIGHPTTFLIPSAPAPAPIQTSNPIPQTPTPTTTQSIEAKKEIFTFTHNLRVGDIDPDVAKLQTYLSDAGFPVSPAGKPGSKGFETTKFGRATKAALIKFQKAKGISPASGNLGPITRAYINSHQ